MRKIFLLGVVAFAVVFAATFFGVQFFTKTGIFRIPGVVYYDESLEESEIALLDTIFTEEVDLDKDVTVSARYEFELPELSNHEFLVQIYTPVSDFYSPAKKIVLENPVDIFQREIQENLGFEIRTIENLNYTQRLANLNGAYYLDDFKSGAVFRIVNFESEKYEEEIAPLVAEKFAVLSSDFPNADTVLTFAQTGVTAFSRVMNAKMNAVNDGDYFAAKIGEFLSSFDLTHTSNESSFVDAGTAPTGGATGVPICADERFQKTLLGIGLDIVELTGNHNQDCGDAAALETLQFYRENGIKVVGGGETADAAAIPLELNAKGSEITMLAYNLSTGGATYDNTPGANQYYEEVAAAQIKEAKARGDFVIVDVQYYECNAYASTYEDPTCDYANSAAGDQVGLFRHLIDLGADVVVGTAAHQAQTFELYGDGVIYYGLGNLFFDQIKWPGTTRSLILVHHFYKNRLLATQLAPTVYDSDFQTRLMDEETSEWWIKRLAAARP